MNLADLGTVEIPDNAVEQEEPSLDNLDNLEAVVFEDSSILESLESDERDGDEMGAARPSGYNKTLPYRDWETDRKSTRLNSSH